MSQDSSNFDTGTCRQTNEEHVDEQDVILWEHKGEQVRFTVSEFRGNLYMGIRYWIHNMEEEWIPTKAGFSIPYNLDTTARLFKALTQILSKAEVLEEVMKHAEEVEVRTVDK